MNKNLIIKNILDKKNDKIGIIGGIASGKSEIENKLIENNIEIIDTDKIMYLLREGNDFKYKDINIEEDIFKVRKKLENNFKDLYRNNKFNRNELLRLINDKIEGITNYNIYKKIMKKYVKNIILEFSNKNKNKLIVVSSAMIIDFDLYNYLDEIYVLDYNIKKQIENIIKREKTKGNKIDEEDAKKAVKRQLTYKETLDFLKNNYIGKLRY